MIDSNDKNLSLDGDNLSLKDLFFLLVDKWKLITLLTSIAAIISVIYSLSLPNVYQSTAKLKPAESYSQGVSSTLSQYSGLASMAGITLPSTVPQMDSSTLAIEVLRSIDFFEILYAKEELLINITALKEYDNDTREVLIDPEIYDYDNKVWTREPSEIGNIKPSLQEAHELFLENNLFINKDLKTGVVSITIQHISPYIASEIASSIVSEINTFMKRKQTEEAVKSKAFLEDQLQRTQFIETQKMLSALLEKDIQTLLLSSITDEYVFEYIDTPRIPEKKSGPVRSTICIFGTIIGGIISILIVLLIEFLPSYLRKD